MHAFTISSPRPAQRAALAVALAFDFTQARGRRHSCLRSRARLLEKAGSGSVAGGPALRHSSPTASRALPLSSARSLRERQAFGVGAQIDFGREFPARVLERSSASWR